MGLRRPLTGENGPEAPAGQHCSQLDCRIVAADPFKSLATTAPPGPGERAVSPTSQPFTRSSTISLVSFVEGDSIRGPVLLPLNWFQQFAVDRVRAPRDSRARRHAVAMRFVSSPWDTRLAWRPSVSLAVG